MLVKPTVPELLRESGKNRYSLVIATAKRARQISKGSIPMTNEEEASPITFAADEIGEGKVKVLDEEQWNEQQNTINEDVEDVESKEEQGENNE